MKKFIYITLSIIILLSCTEIEETDTDIPYLNFNKFIDSEIQDLNNNPKTLIKTVCLNGTSDKISQDSIDYENFLKPLREYDVHKPNLIGAYAIDTSIIQDTTRITYSANSKKLSIKKIQYSFLNDVMVKMEGVEKTSGFFSESYQKVIYRPQKQLTITNKTNTWFLSQSNMTMDGKLL